MAKECTCDDLVNNGDHYCPIHGMYAPNVHDGLNDITRFKQPIPAEPSPEVRRLVKASGLAKQMLLQLSSPTETKPVAKEIAEMAVYISAALEPFKEVAR